MREMMLIFWWRLFYHFHLHRVFRKRASGSCVISGPDQEAVMLCFYLSAFYTQTPCSLCVCFIVYYVNNSLFFLENQKLLWSSIPFVLLTSWDNILKGKRMQLIFSVSVSRYERSERSTKKSNKLISKLAMNFYSLCRRSCHQY